uniref:G-protein coupled receptors family 1 profile domain-containing protein n=1 Tax=Glossina brevipalpis TaxID=37001 RepID=A0A1A9WV99_9MUSC
MDNKRNLESDSQTLLPAFLKVTCTEWLNDTDCENLTFSITNNGIWNNVTKAPSDSLLEMDLEYEYDDNTWPLERIISAIVPIFFGIIGFAGLLGNALVILVVMVNKQMRSTTNLLIINLAVSDILFVIFCVPFTATDYMLPEWPFGDPWCKYVQYMIVVTCHCSVYTLVLMSFDRFLAVVHPVTSMSLRTERNASIAIIMAWMLIVTTAIPVALAHSVRYYNYRGRHYTACVFSTDNKMWSHLGFQLSFFLSSYVAPLTLICFLYIGMLARLWKSAPGCKPSAESRKGKRRVTRMVVVVVLAFAICWLPIHVVWCGSPPPVITNQQVTKTTRTATGNGTSNIDML